MRDWSRRELLATLLGLPAVFAGCRRATARPPLPAGRIVGASMDLGHQLRKKNRTVPKVAHWLKTKVVIIGGGVAGYSAARRLKMAGMTDFVLLELEPEPGGLSRSGHSKVVSYPWAAHYLPVPMKENRSLLALLDEMGLLTGRDEFDEAIVAEPFLCRQPEERLFADGRWQEGLVDRNGATPTESTEFQAFDQLIDDWVAWRDETGRRAFAIPLADCSQDTQVTQLDRISMEEWLDQHNLRYERLRWYVDYCCRDDYGMTASQTSAWAGLFYFASRIRRPGDESQPLITWPEGNGRLISHMHQMVAEHVRLGLAATDIIPAADADQHVEVIATGRESSPVVGFQTSCVIYAVPQFLRPFLIRQAGDDHTHVQEFEYGSWMVANLHLTARPQEKGIPLCWDNILRDSPSLGYVVATHQARRSTGPTVFTYYYPLCDDNPNDARARLMERQWEDWAEITLSDLEQAHPDLRRLVERLDVMRWGHAMIRARPGFIWSQTRRQAARPFGRIHFANSDLSGLPLFEEAFYHGNRAAEEVLAELDISFASVL